MARWNPCRVSHRIKTAVVRVPGCERLQHIVHVFGMERQTHGSGDLAAANDIGHAVLVKEHPGNWKWLLGPARLRDKQQYEKDPDSLFHSYLLSNPIPL